MRTIVLGDVIANVSRRPSLLGELRKQRAYRSLYRLDGQSHRLRDLRPAYPRPEEAEQLSLAIGERARPRARRQRDRVNVARKSRRQQMPWVRRMPCVEESPR